MKICERNWDDAADGVGPGSILRVIGLFIAIAVQRHGRVLFAKEVARAVRQVERLGIEVVSQLRSVDGVVQAGVTWENLSTGPIDDRHSMSEVMR